jgi:integrase
VVKQKKSGGAWYYEFMHHGKRYFGTCEGAKSQRQAEAFERTVREKATQAAGLKSVKALYETFREDLTGGKRISLDDAFELAMKKPRKRTPAEKQISIKRGIWQDYLDFMRGEHPEIVYLSDVVKTHAEEYVARIRESGKYNKAIQYSRTTRKKRNTSQTISYTASENTQLSPRTTNYYQVVCAEVFNLLKDDVGLQENPFSSILKLDMKNETREAFTPDELQTIFDNLDGFTRPLFMMAVWTGLREGDICTLKWSDVDLERRLISRKTRKTGTSVQIPISDQLYSLLAAEPRTDFEYVFPKHAEMYLANPSGVSYRVKQFLEGLGIQTTRIPEGRTRAISVKDLHSCRHTFCYYAGIAGIPLAVVQSIVGHMSPEMTKHYSAHATLEDKRRGMKQLSFFTPKALPNPEEEPERARFRKLADTLPIETIKKMIDFYEGVLK